MANISRLDLNLFPVFEAIYREGNLSRAAEVLHLTQPAVSHALARLRDALDDPLFVRRGRNMVPTPRARQLIGPVRQALTTLHTGVEQSRHFDPGRLQRTFRISLRDLFEVMVLPHLMQRLREQAPGVTLSVVRTPRQQIEHDLATGRVDFAADAWFNPGSAIAHVPISDDRLVCLMRPGHPALSGEWSLGTMLRWPHVLVSSREQGGGYEDVQLARHGLSRTVALRTPHYFSAALVVAQSELMLCAPARFARLLRRAVALDERPFPLTLPPLEVFLYWHRLHDTDPAHQWLREQILDVLRIRLGTPGGG